MSQKKVEVILVPNGDTPNSIPGTHKQFIVSINGVMVGELIHRTSKDSYHTNISDAFNMLDPNQFTGWNFDKSRVEAELSEKMSSFINLLNI